MKWITLTAIGLMTVVSHPGLASAQTVITPQHFALAASAFPPGSRLVAAHVEPNARVGRDRVLHFGSSFAEEGRLTGYFMDAVEGNRDLPRVDLSYLVSIFGTTEQAAAAFAQQQSFWEALTRQRSGDPSGGPASSGNSFGPASTEALYRFEAFDGWTLYEHLFYRGTVFVEVFLELRIAHPSRADMKAYLGLGATLDALCQDL
jgi:hypothetical protein